MTKNLLGIRGQLRLILAIKIHNRYGEVIGYSTKNNVRDNFNNMLKLAILNAKYRFYAKKMGRKVPTNLNFTYEIIDYDVIYDENLIVKRENYKGHYYTYVRNKDTGKVIKRYKYTYEESKELPDVNIYEE